MKHLFTLTLLCFGLMAHAQPQKVNYQAVAVNASGITVKNRVISLKLSILDSSSTGSVLYSETHQPTTVATGQFSVYLGGGTSVFGTFSSIPWGNGKGKFLKAEADVNGGTSYVLMGVSQIVSVPYALAAGSLNEGATVTAADGRQYTISIGQNGPVWNLTNPNVNFNCGQSVTYDGESYPSVQIGTQCWFQKNLNVGTFVNANTQQSNNGIIEKYCYNNDTTNCNIYGGLYLWAEAVQYQNGATNNNLLNSPFLGNVNGICPVGWHIPSNAEFCTLNTYLDTSVNCSKYGLIGTDIGGKLKSTNNLWIAPNVGANNLSFFSSIPSGFRGRNGPFTGIGTLNYLWTSTEVSNSGAVYFYIANIYSKIYKNTSKDYGYSVRCLKD